MARDGLASLLGKKKRSFSGKFVRFGSRPIYKRGKVRTVVLSNVKAGNSDEILCDHIWLDSNFQFEALELSRGDIITFSGKVYTYGAERLDMKTQSQFVEVEYGIGQISRVKRVRNHG